jgi:hypothetical protein
MKLFCLLMMAGSLGASSIEPFVSGTRPYETVPYKEVNATLLGSIGEEYDSGGASLDWGVLDHWTLWGAWQKSDEDPSAQTGNLGTQIRIGEEGQYPLDFGLCYELKGAWDDNSGNYRQVAGFVVAKEIDGNSLDSNLLYDTVDGFEGRFAYRSPYLLSALRAGCEMIVENSSSYPVFIPQLICELPGDIAVQVGDALANDGAPSTWLFTASYEIFQNP